MTDAQAGVRNVLHKTVLLLAVVLPLVATVYAIYLLWNRWVTWREVAVLGAMYTVSALGITIGFHRMLTHRGFDAPAPVRAFFLALGSMALEGPAVEWAATHVKHHAKADQEGDPHSPLEGFWHAHFGWLFRDRFVKTGVWAKPFEGDRVAHFIDKTFVVWATVGFVLPGLAVWALGGSFWMGVLWGGLVRTFLVHHVTWSVNSVCHTFGKRPYATKDESRNNWIVGLLAFGEGWHNNHHASPQTAIHGFRWWQFDMSGYIIRAMARLGIAKHVHRAKPAPQRAPAAPRAPGPASTRGGGSE